MEPLPAPIDLIPAETASLQRRAAWLAAGVVLSAATQLRFSGSVGPGELILLAWCAASAVAALGRPRPAPAPAIRPFLLFWACSLPLLAAGWTVAWSRGIAAPGALRDFLSYGLLAVIVACLAYKPGGAEELRAAARAALVTCTLVLFPLLVYAVVYPRSGPLQLWHWGRYIGWSRNPNQVPLEVILTPFLALYGFMRCRGALERCGLVLLACCAVPVGLASRSDALFLAWPAGVAVLAAHAWLLALRGRSVARRGKVLLVVAPLLVAGLVLADGRAVDRVARELAEIRDGQEKGAERTYLWRTSLEAVAASPLVGLGPGAHARVRKPHGSVPAEAHNSYIDWASATGLLGTILLFSLLLHVARSALRDPPLLAALVSLLVYGVAHHNLRHPIVWIYLLLIAVEGRRQPHTEPPSS